MKRTAALATLAITAGVFAIPAPAQAAVPWNGKTIQVINKLPRDWPVTAAVSFVDSYTGSRMSVVRKCTPAAWKCITIKQGRLSDTAGWSSGSTITIDVYRTKHIRGWKGNFGPKTKKWLLVHELGHQRFLQHQADCTTAMDPRQRCGRPKHVPPLKFSTTQKRKLAQY